MQTSLMPWPQLVILAVLWLFCLGAAVLPSHVHRAGIWLFRTESMVPSPTAIRILATAVIVPFTVIVVTNILITKLHR